jgi:hypothetical protein
MEGTAAQIGAARHIWEESVLTFRTFTSVQQTLKKQIITVFEPMHLDILNDEMVGFANITAWEILDHLFMTYVNITAVDLENNFEQMRTHSRYIWGVLKSSPLGTSWAHVAGGMISQTLRKLGHNSRLTSSLHTGSTSKCKVNLQIIQVTMQQTPLWFKHKINWLKPPLALWPTWLQPQQLTAEW